MEEHFYLVWPLLMSRLPLAWSRRVLWLGFLPLAVGSAALVILAPRIGPLAALIDEGLASGSIRAWDPAKIIYQGTPFRASSLAIGCLFAFGEQRLTARPALTLAGSLLGLVLAVYTVVQAAFRVPLEWLPVVRLLGFNLVSGLVVLGALAADAGRIIPAQLLSCAPLRAVGRISYGLYLYHLPVFELLRVDQRGGTTPPWQVGAAVAATFAVAGLSYAFIERPLLRYAGRFRG